jgi:ABC-2 type transport system ATP-binding protein
MINVRDLTKSYGSIEALRGVSFEVQSGEIVGLLGPNGAGKSTTIKILTGYLHPDSGTVTVDDLDVLAQAKQVQARIGYLSENTPLYPSLSIQAYLKFMADMRGVPEDQQPALISEAIVATGLVDYRARLIGQLSKGLRQRVGLAQAILHKPRLLILDEPTIGLDPTQIVEIRGLIKRLSASSTILFSSHILSEVEALCDRVVIIINGQVRADARLDELTASTDTVLVLQDEAPGVRERLAALQGVTRVEPFRAQGRYAAFRVVGDSDLAPAIYEAARHEAWAVRELRRDTPTLETIFNQLATTA